MADIRFAGDYSLTKAVLTSYNGNEVNIMDLIHNIKVYEDIFSPFITIDMVMEDHIGLYHKMPIIGEELLTLTLTDVTGKFGFKDAIFSLYKSKDFVEKGQRGFVYTLSFISVEAIRDMNLKISKAYNGTAKDIAYDLLKKEGLTTNKDVYIEESKYKISYISNYWPPIKNLKYLCQRAVSKITDSASYLFFENKFGFYFTSLAALKGQDPIASFYYSANIDDDLEKSLQRVEKIHIDRGVDYIDRLQNGAYGSNVVYMDPTKKSYYYKYLDFINAFEKQPRMNELPFSSNDATRRVNGNFFMDPTPSFTRNGMNNDYTERWFQERLIELGALRSFEVQIDVPGSLYVAVGQTADLHMYTGDVPSTNNINFAMDPMFSGRYLISSICHNFNRTRHDMSMTLCKDSLTKKVNVK